MLVWDIRSCNTIFFISFLFYDCLRFFICVSRGRVVGIGVFIIFYLGK